MRMRRLLHQPSESLAGSPGQSAPERRQAPQHPQDSAPGASCRPTRPADPTPEPPKHHVTWLDS